MHTCKEGGRGRWGEDGESFPQNVPASFSGRGLSCVLRGERPCLSSRARRTHAKAALAGLEEPVGLLVRLNAKRAFLVLVLHFPPPQNERSSRASCARAVSRGLCWRKALRGCAWARDAPGISAARAWAGRRGRGKRENGERQGGRQPQGSLKVFQGGRGGDVRPRLRRDGERRVQLSLHYTSSHHLFSSRTCASSSGVKSFLMLNALRISSGLLPLMTEATLAHVRSSRLLMSM
jgi:hypothetical protein